MDGVFSSNYLTTLRSILTSWQKLIDDWEQIRYDWEMTKEFLRQKQFIFFYAKIRPVLSTMYYWGTTDITNLLMKEIDLDQTISENVVVGFKVVYFLLFFVFYFWVVVDLKERMVGYYSLLVVLPLELVHSNKGLVFKLEKAFKGDKLI